MPEKKPKCYMPHEYINESNYAESTPYKHMFIEDIKNRIIPISLRREDNCKATIKCSDNDLDSVKSILNSFNDYEEKYNINELVIKVIESITKGIASHGESIYEIYKISDNEIKFIRLRSHNFIDLKLFHIQIPPKKTDERLLPKFISNKSLWKISIPQELQKNYSYKRILSSIDSFDFLMPKSMRDDLYQGNNLSRYDTKKYAEKRFLFVNDLTKDWNWDQRKWTSNDYTTEFFNHYKRLKFQLAVTKFREHIIIELNKLFIRLGINARINLEGLFSSKEYEECIKKYLNDEIQYKDIFNFL